MGSSRGEMYWPTGRMDVTPGQAWRAMLAADQALFTTEAAHDAQPSSRTFLDVEAASVAAEEAHDAWERVLSSLA